MRLSPRAIASLRRSLPALTLVATFAPFAPFAVGLAAAQVPPTRRTSESSVAPMPTPSAIHSTPPDLRSSASTPATAPATPTMPTPPGPAPAAGASGSGSATPAGGDGPPPGSDPDAGPEAPRSSRVVKAENPADDPDSARRRRIWGEASTLFKRDAKVGLYIAPSFKATSINHRPGLMLGADLAVVIAERFSIGAAGSALTTPLPALRNDGRTLNMRMQYAGLTLGVALVRVKFFVLGVSAMVGGGRVCLNDERLDRCVNRAALFVAEPELGVSFALTKVLRLALSGGYRVAVAQAWSGPSDNALRGFTGTLALRLGRF